MPVLRLCRPDLLRTENFIAGAWRGAEQVFEVSDPASGELVAEVPDSGPAQARQAADAACAAFPAWKAAPARQRAQILKRWHGLIMTHKDDLARLLSREQGKPVSESAGEIAYAASYLEWFAELIGGVNGDVIPAPGPGRRLFALKEPVGVVAAITPWNFPSAMIARKIAPALAAGCTVVCKPSEDAPLSALALAVLAEEAGLPVGVLNIVTASRQATPGVVDAWLDDDRIRKLTFTGSTSVGKHLARRSADTLKKLSLELGGNAPFIVFEDADVEAAVEGLISAKFRNGGQTCVSPNRIFVHSARYEAFASRLAARVSALKVGPASEPDSQIGPMINLRAVEKIQHHVRDALEKGARLLAGGKRLASLGENFFAPTVLADVDASMACCCEETFGPVAAISRFDDESEVLALANDTPFGLAAYFFSNDVRRIWRVADALETGMVGVNEGAISTALAPFGGVKQSGYGREGSVHGLDDYMQIKYVCLGGLA